MSPASGKGHMDLMEQAARDALACDVADAERLSWPRAARIIVGLIAFLWGCIIVAIAWWR